MRKCMRSLIEPKLVTLMGCAALSFWLVSQFHSLEGLFRMTGFEGAGFDHFAISLFASRPGRISCKICLSAGHRIN